MSATILLWLTSAVGLYMAWNIGANDVANAMGTSVGSGALTLRKAIILAGVLEFLGAVLVGGYVTDTVRKGIVDPAVFSSDPHALICGMMAALAAAAVWLNLASYLGWPVSTTHSIVGAVTGFGLLTGGVGAVNWAKMGAIISSWLISPAVGGVVAYVVYSIVRRRIIETVDPAEVTRKYSPVLGGMLLFVIALVMLFKGLKNLHLHLHWWQTMLTATVAAIIGASVWALLGRRSNLSGLEGMEDRFRMLQVATAATVAFAHGANDVANAVGPMAAVYATATSGAVVQQVAVPIWMLMVGGLGIVIGLATYGYRVMATVGEKITEMTPSRGFVAEFGASITILGGSKLGLPLSTTHTLIGAVMGVGFARGMSALNLGIIRNIMISWLLTVPVAAVLTVPLYYLLRWVS